MESGFRSSNSVISSSFARLKEHPAVWTDYKEYLELGKWVMDLSVTNEAAERGVKNAQKVALSSKSESTRECNMLVMNMCGVCVLDCSAREYEFDSCRCQCCYICFSS